MPRLLASILIIGFLLPSLSVASESPAVIPVADEISVPIYLFADERSGILAIALLTDELFVWAYGYDSSGKRVSLRESSASGVTTTVFPTPSYSETTLPNGTIERTVSIEVAGLPVATVRTVGTSTPEVFATHTDHLRSIRLATDQTGAVVESTDYDPFGKITNHVQSGTFTERKKFTSQHLLIN